MERMSYAGKKQKKNSLMKQFMLLFFGSFFLGVIIMNVFGNYFINEYGVLSEYYLKEFQYGGIVKEELFLYLIKHRLLVFVGIGLLLGTVYRKLVAGGFLVVKGFTLGFLLTAGILKYGGKGLALILVALFPHSLIYYPLYFGLFSLMLTRPGKKWKEAEFVAIQKRKGVILRCIYMGMMFFMGIVLETYVNPPCLLYYLSHFW